MLRTIAKLLRVLNSEVAPGQISLGFCLALVAGFTPVWSLHNLVVLLLVLFLRVNLSAFLLGWVCFSGVAYVLDPVFHAVGLIILTHPGLEGLWTDFYNSSLWRLERFYNSIVMGSLVVSVSLMVPLFFVSNVFIRRYREHILAWIHKTKLMQVFKAGKLYQAYQAVARLGGGP